MRLPAAEKPCRYHNLRDAANYALFGQLFAEIVVRNLNQNARAVTHQRIGADSAPVIEILQNLQALLDNRVAFPALDMRYKTDTAGVVLVGRVVQPLPLRYSRIDHFRTLTKQ
jgi:hypothetical protein